ncbi:hypothetical protein HF086_006175 [Spodoptera exigua]|uniref:Uncharacterized protein n=1 Tax=Spodoptera exigua TaxID=7107 RepID=A0A922SU27_SPOEX|nr:hypothetical protein HF086_006175 [Spodoptera exigua]
MFLRNHCLNNHRGISLTLLAVDLPTTSAVKATSLIFSKTSTTAAPEETAEDGVEVSRPEDQWTSIRVD